MAKTKTQTAAPSAQVAAALTANSEVQALAALFGVNWIALIRCLVTAVKPAELLKCLRSDDVLGCLLETVDFEKVLGCALSAVGGGEPEFTPD